MDNTEWIARCEAQYMKRGGLSKLEAEEAAEICFESWDGDTSPEDEADADMDCWTDDGDE